MNFYNLETLNKIKISDLVKNNQTVNFAYYRAGNLWYSHTSGLEFPVPIQDLGDASCMASHKAITLMRYMRKHLDTLKKELFKDIK